MEHVSEILKRVVQNILTDENVRFSFIARIFNYYKFLGTEEKQVKRYGMDYYGRTFDYLYDLTLDELEALDIRLHGLSQRYADIEGE